MSREERYKFLSSTIGKSVTIASSAVAVSVAGSIGSAAAYIAVTEGLSAVTTAAIGAFFIGSPGWLAWLALALGTAAGFHAGFKLGSLEEKYIGIGKNGGSIVGETIATVMQEIPMHRNKLIFLCRSTFVGFLLDKCISSAIGLPFCSLQKNATSVFSTLYFLKGITMPNGIVGASIGFGFALSVIGLYYGADSQGQEIRRANRRLSDTIGNLLKTVGLTKETKISDLRQFREKTHSISDSPQFEIPKEYLCPITHSIMIDPVTAPDGHAYERQALQQWYDIGKVTPPMDRSKVLENPRALPTNEPLSKLIKIYVEESHKQLSNFPHSSERQAYFDREHCFPPSL